MKNIRFRIWNENNMELGGDKTCALQLHVCRNTSLNADDTGVGCQDIMLATGIKDKDANEVYEGDICRGKISIACVVKEIESGIVAYNPDNARFELKCSDSSLPLNMISGLQVISHIYNKSNYELNSSAHCDLK